MQFASSVLAFAAIATTAFAAPIPQVDVLSSLVSDPTAEDGQIDFISTDSNDRTVYCTPSIGHESIDPVDLPAGQTVSTIFPEHWIGNCYAVIAGQPNVPGMLAEINFNDWLDKTYFDVSAIVDASDVHNVYAMVPGDGSDPISGCMTGVADGSCNDNIYTYPDAIQTKVTDLNHLKVYIGYDADSASATASTKRSVDDVIPSVDRSFITGESLLTQ